MGEVIELAERRRRQAAAAPDGAAAAAIAPRATCFFDLAAPGTYLVAEAVERAFACVRWVPVTSAALYRGARPAEDDLVPLAAELRLPLAWPERYPEDVPAAMRVASLAAERGRGGGFVLAASRLAFCGGFDLDDPEILAEAAAAAGLGLDDALHAAGDHGRDGAMEADGRRLLAAGIPRLPALTGPAGTVSGERAVLRAASATAARRASLRARA